MSDFLRQWSSGYGRQLTPEAVTQIVLLIGGLFLAAFFIDLIRAIRGK